MSWTARVPRLSTGRHQIVSKMVTGMVQIFVGSDLSERSCCGLRAIGRFDGVDGRRDSNGNCADRSDSNKQQHRSNPFEPTRSKGIARERARTILAGICGRVAGARLRAMLVIAG